MKTLTRLLAALTLALALLSPPLAYAVAIDDFAPNATGLDSPSRHAVAVTPSDGSTLTHVSRALWVGTAGTVCVDTQGTEANICFTNATGWMPIQATKVYATGTTASGIIEVW